MTVTAHLPFSWITHPHQVGLLGQLLLGYSVVLDLFLGYPSANVKCHGIYKRATVLFVLSKQSSIQHQAVSAECSEPFKLTPIIRPCVKLWGAFLKPNAM